MDVDDRGYSLELAAVLRGGSEITLGLSDAERCAKALTIVATKIQRRTMMAVLVPAIVLALLVGGVIGDYGAAIAQHHCDRC
jgi:hypothetical protein